jgi:hypothetical protein
VVLVAATLLVTLWLTARSILAHAGRALRAAEAIRDNTRPIWALETTNEVAEQLSDTIRAIEAKSAQLVEALEGHAVASDRR